MDDGLRTRIASACAGSLATSLVANPFDVIRVRMQQSSALQPSLVPFQASSLLSNVPAQKSTFVKTSLGVSVCCRDVFWFPSTVEYCVATQQPHDCIIDAKKATTWSTLRSIVSSEGPSTLWRGLSVQLVQSIPANVIYFIAYENLRDYVSPTLGPAISPLLCGGAARTMSSAIVSPLELFRTRLQSVEVPEGRKASAIVMKSVRDMLKTDGIKSLWSGLGLTLWRDVPFSSIYWLIVESVRTHMFGAARTSSDKFVESFTSGCLGGIVAATVTTPFDVGKTRRQIGSRACTSAHMSMPTFMAHIVRQEGWRALFVGLGPRVFKVAPACGIMITSYELGKHFIKTASLEPDDMETESVMN